MDKLGKLLRFVMQINSCIDCDFETQTFHPHLSYNPKSGWVGLFQPHVDMSRLKDLSVISRTNFYIFASCYVILETFWKQNGNFLPIQPRHFQWPHLFEKEPICCNSHPFSFLGYLWETAWQLGLHFGIETRVFSSWYWWVISTWTQVLEDQVVSVCFSINFTQQHRSHWWWRVILITLPNGSF